MTQHTPGPWHVIAGAPSLIEAVTAPTSADNNGRRIIAQALDPVPYIGVERMRANARLIAAAPVLLTHLRDMTRLLADMNRHQHAGLGVAPGEWSDAYAATTAAYALIDSFAA